MQTQNRRGGGTGGICEVVGGYTDGGTVRVLGTAKTAPGASALIIVPFPAIALVCTLQRASCTRSLRSELRVALWEHLVT